MSDNIVKLNAANMHANSYALLSRLLSGFKIKPAAGVDTSDVVCTALYICKSMTVEQLSRIDWSFKSLSGISRCLSEMIKKGYVVSTSISGTSARLYSLTQFGYERTRKLIVSLYAVPIAERAERAATALYGYSEYQRVRQAGRGLHKVLTNDVFIALSMSDFTAFNWQAEVPVDKSGTVYLKTFDGYDKICDFKDVKLRADGFVSYNNMDNMPANIFVEQDTGSQDSAKIGHKLNNYMDYVIPSLNEQSLRNNCILFSLYIERPVLNLKASVKTEYFDSLYNYRVFVETLLFDITDKALTLNDLNNRIEAAGEGKIKAVLGRSYNGFRLALNRINEKHGANSKLLPFLTKPDTSAQKKELERKRDDSVNRSYVARRNSITDVVCGNERMKGCILKGFDINFIGNHNAKELIPYLSLTDNSIHSIITSFGEDVQNCTIRYKEIVGDGIHVSTTVLLPTGRRLIIENISDSASGYVRMRELISVAPSLGNTILVCICDGEKAINRLTGNLISPISCYKSPVTYNDVIAGKGTDVIYLTYEHIAKGELKPFVRMRKGDKIINIELTR